MTWTKTAGTDSATRIGDNGANPAHTANTTRAPHAIELMDVRKSFGEHPVLQGISLVVPPGEVFGFLGPNGAGKTTTVRLLNGLFPADAGEARVLGLDCARQASLIRLRTGVVIAWLAGWGLLRLGERHFTRGQVALGLKG